MPKQEERQLVVTRQIADEICEEANQSACGFFEITPEDEERYTLARNAESISRKGG